MHKHMLPRISIVMPVLNSANTIEKAISSVIDQHYENVELIIIDGGSTDDTLEIIKKYEDHIAHWQSEHDGSSSVALNKGIQKATGDVVAFLMADDWYEPETLSKVGRALLDYPDVDMISCGGRIIYYQPEIQTYQTSWLFNSEKDLHLSLYNVCFAVSAICCRFIKKSFYEKVGLYIPFDSEGKHRFTNDKEFLLRAILQQPKNKVIPHLGYNHLAHAGSATFTQNYKTLSRICHEHLEIAELFLQRQDLTFGQRLLFKLWYQDQATRLFLYQTLQKNFSAGLLTLKLLCKKYPLSGVPAFCFLGGKVVVKMIKKKLRAARASKRHRCNV